MSDIARAQIFDNCPDVKMYLKSDLDASFSDKSCLPRREEEINLTSIDVDTDGHYVVAHTEEGSQYFVDELVVEKNFLHVPGVGHLRPGSKVRLEKDPTSYILLFGWHTNISNQTIYSWYLRPIKEFDDSDHDQDYMSSPEKVLSEDKTLYFEMIDKIWKVGVSE